MRPVPLSDRQVPQEDIVGVLEERVHALRANQPPTRVGGGPPVELGDGPRWACDLTCDR